MRESKTFGRRKARIVEIKESARKSSVELADPSFGHDPAALELLIKSTKDGDDNIEGHDNEEDESFTALDEVGMPTEKWVPWLEMTAKQADESGLGSSVTLSKLVDNNETLMREAVALDLLKRFRQLIMDNGPHSRFLKLFEAICSSNGKNIVANQENTLRLLWLNEKIRNRLLIDISEKKKGKRSLYEKDASPPKPDAMPEDFLGKEETSNGEQLPDIFVEWYGSDVWETGKHELFFTPKMCGIHPLEFKDGDAPPALVSRSRRGSIFGDKRGNSAQAAPKMETQGTTSNLLGVNGNLIRVELLCWVLEPDVLCQKVLGREWKDHPANPDFGAATSRPQYF